MLFVSLDLHAAFSSDTCKDRLPLAALPPHLHTPTQSLPLLLALDNGN